jgi:GntR family transcriptional regulator
MPEVIAETLREEILQGRLRPGEQLTAEPALAARLGVSRASLRQALARLIYEGALIRQRGIGTFVSTALPVVLRGGLTTLTSTTDLIRRHGYEPGTRLRRLEQLQPSDDIVEICGYPPGTPFWHISRIRLASGCPVIRCEDYVPVRLLRMATLSGIDEAKDWSLYALLEAAGAAPVTASCVVIPIVAEGVISDELEMKPGIPLLLIKQVHYGEGGEVVLYSENWHNSSIVEFEFIRKAGGFFVQMSASGAAEEDQASNPVAP